MQLGKIRKRVNREDGIQTLPSSEPELLANTLGCLSLKHFPYLEYLIFITYSIQHAR